MLSAKLRNILSVFGKLKQENHEFKASLCHTERPCPKNRKGKEEKGEGERREKKEGREGGRREGRREERREEGRNGGRRARATTGT
jgi:hypothetical protein